MSESKSRRSVLLLPPPRPSSSPFCKSRAGTMASAGRVPGGFLDNAYRLLMRRNSVYVTFILAGAVVGERVRLSASLVDRCPRSWIGLEL